MKTSIVVSLSLVFLASYARAQSEQQAQPTAPAPTDAPPPPPDQPPPPPAEAQLQGPEELVAEQHELPPGGQWVFTDQYGWLWMPYGDQYTYEPVIQGAYPYSYVFYPTYGWMWVSSPWVWGWGPWPYFGYYGPTRFVWYRNLGSHRVGWAGAYRAGWGAFGRSGTRTGWGTFSQGRYHGAVGGGRGGYHPSGGARGGRH